ncbi:hypothetical protein CRUP_027269, partial [Coryphaenoides rupestris]
MTKGQVSTLWPDDSTWEREVQARLQMLEEERRRREEAERRLQDEASHRRRLVEEEVKLREKNFSQEKEVWEEEEEEEEEEGSIFSISSMRWASCPLALRHTEDTREPRAPVTRLGAAAGGQTAVLLWKQRGCGKLSHLSGEQAQLPAETLVSMLSELSRLSVSYAWLPLEPVGLWRGRGPAELGAGQPPPTVSVWSRLKNQTGGAHGYSRPVHGRQRPPAELVALQPASQPASTPPGRSEESIGAGGGGAGGGGGGGAAAARERQWRVAEEEEQDEWAEAEALDVGSRRFEELEFCQLEQESSLEERKEARCSQLLQEKAEHQRSLARRK